MAWNKDKRRWKVGSCLVGTGKEKNWDNREWTLCWRARLKKHWKSHRGWQAAGQHGETEGQMLREEEAPLSSSSGSWAIGRKSEASCKTSSPRWEQKGFFPKDKLTVLASLRSSQFGCCCCWDRDFSGMPGPYWRSHLFCHFPGLRELQLGVILRRNVLLKSKLPWVPDNKKWSCINGPGVKLPQTESGKIAIRTSHGEVRANWEHIKKVRWQKTCFDQCRLQ